MAFQIKVAPRTVIDPSFMHGVEYVYGSFFELAKRQTRHQTSKEIQEQLLRFPDAARRVVDWQTNRQEERRGTNYDIQVRLQTANQYVRMLSTNVGGTTWLIGETKDIILTGSRRWNDPNDPDDPFRKKPRDYNMGKYSICVDANSLVNMNFRMHLIPAGDPRTTCRHPHHYADSSSESNPLKFSEHTCLGSFSTGILACVHSMDIAGLFTNLYTYVGRYNASSPFKGLEQRGNFTWVQ